MAEFFAAGREFLVPLLVQAAQILFAAGYALLLPAAAFAVLALAAKRRNALAAAVRPASWSVLPPVLVGFLAIVAGDFVGYWRHRLEHTRLLWPSHAVHHSDTEMTWLALARFHPVSRLVTLLLDNSVLFLLGLPPYALLVNNFVRHYWGY